MADKSHSPLWPPPMTTPDMYGIAEQPSNNGHSPDVHVLQGSEKLLTPHIVRMSEVAAEPIDWLWTDFIARGKFGLWEGDPGVGKTFALLAVAAAVTRGSALPGMVPAEPANVLLLTVEDDLADTIKPRLEQLDADASRVYALDEPLALDGGGVAFLENALTEYKPALTIFDPIMGYIPGNIDIYKANQIRAVTTPLRMLAKNHHTAIVAIRHLTKAQKERAIYRGAGGIDFVGASRLVVLVGCDPDNPKQRAIVQTKTNLGNQGRAVGYTLEGGAFYWTGESDLTAEKLLSAASAEKGSSALDEAIDFLREYLARGRRRSPDVSYAAKQVGIKTATLERAKKAMGVRATKEGEPGKQGGGGWYLSLPQQNQGGPPEPHED